MRKKNTHEKMKHAINQVVKEVINVFAVSYDLDLHFRPLRYYSPCEVYTTHRTIKNIQLLIIAVHITNPTKRFSKINMSCALSV